jgi:hypothetical protein
MLKLDKEQADAVKRGFQLRLPQADSESVRSFDSEFDEIDDAAAEVDTHIVNIPEIERDCRCAIKLRGYHCEIKAISQEACAKAEAMLKAQVRYF